MKPQKENQTRSENPVRRKILKRADDSKRPKFRLTQRDIDIVTAVYKYRVLTAPQIYSLFFSKELLPIGGKSVSSRCQLRLKNLYHSGLLHRFQQPLNFNEGSKPLLYQLDKEAVPLLARVFDVSPDEIDWKPKDNKRGFFTFLNHLLKTNDVMIAIELAAKANGFEIKKWIDETVLRSETMKAYVYLPTHKGSEVKRTLVPDGYVQLSDTNFDYHHFLEIDMGTEDLKRFGEKIPRYLAYYNSGGFEKTYGAKSMRVLIITTGARRAENLRKTTEELGGDIEFWFSDFTAVNPASIFTEPIWSIAGYEGKYSLFDEQVFG